MRLNSVVLSLLQDMPLFILRRTCRIHVVIDFFISYWLQPYLTDSYTNHLLLTLTVVK